MNPSHGHPTTSNIVDLDAPAAPTASPAPVAPSTPPPSPPTPKASPNFVIKTRGIGTTIQKLPPPTGKPVFKAKPAPTETKPKLPKLKPAAQLPLPVVTSPTSEVKDTTAPALAAPTAPATPPAPPAIPSTPAPAPAPASSTATPAVVERKKSRIAGHKAQCNVHPKLWALIQAEARKRTESQGQLVRDADVVRDAITKFFDFVEPVDDEVT